MYGSFFAIRSELAREGLQSSRDTNARHEPYVGGEEMYCRVQDTYSTYLSMGRLYTHEVVGFLYINLNLPFASLVLFLYCCTERCDDLRSPRLLTAARIPGTPSYEVSAECYQESIYHVPSVTLLYALM